MMETGRHRPVFFITRLNPEPPNSPFVRAPICISLLLFTSLASAQYKVRTVDQVVLIDSARHKQIPVKVYFPDARGPFPVIVFSHGAWGSKDGYFALGRYWASHGYVSIHPSHADSRKDSGYRGTLRQTISDPVA